MRRLFFTTVDRITKFFKSASITVVVLTMSGASLFSAIIGASIARRLYGESYPEKVASINIAIACSIFGISGLAQILRKEAPGSTPSRPITGLLAVISGVIFLLLFWGGALFVLAN